MPLCLVYITLIVIRTLVLIDKGSVFDGDSGVSRPLCNSLCSLVSSGVTFVISLAASIQLTTDSFRRRITESEHTQRF